MRLDIPDAVRLDAGDGQRLGDHSRLAVDTRRRIAGLAGAVVVDRSAADDRVDVIAVDERIVQALEDDDADAAAVDGAGGTCVEGTAMSVRGEDSALLEEVADPLRSGDRNAACNGNVAFAGQKALACEVDRNQRCRAGRLYAYVGPRRSRRKAVPVARWSLSVPMRALKGPIAAVRAASERTRSR